LLQPDDLRILIEVVDRGSFSAAAARLGVSKQGVSRRIMALETTLGARLLVRTTRRLSPTADGVGFVERARRILADLDEAAQSVSPQQGAPRGKLRIAAPVSFGTLYLAPVVPPFLLANPEVELDIELNDRLVDLVGEGFDMAVRVGVLEDSALIARRIAAMRVYVCASPDYLARRGTPAHPDALRDHDCLVYSASRSASWQFMIGRQIKTLTVAGRLRANNGELLRDAAIAGLGITRLPDFMIGTALSDGRLCPLLEPFLPALGAVHAVYPTHRQHALTVRSFSDHLHACFSPVAPWA